MCASPILLQDSLAVSVVRQGLPSAGPLTEARLTVEASTIVGNAAYGDGGAFLITSAPTQTQDAPASNQDLLPVRVSFSNCSMSGNTALGSGGVLSVQVTSLGAVLVAATIEDCALANNTAGDMVLSGGTSTFPGCGGAVSMTSVDKLRTHLASSSGAAASDLQGHDKPMEMYGPDTAAALVLRNSTFTGNHALRSGGAVYLMNTPVSISNSTFEANAAEVAGGAVASSVEVPRPDEGNSTATVVFKAVAEGSSQKRLQPRCTATVIHDFPAC
jgi:hypothetical protein